MTTPKKDGQASAGAGGTGAGEGQNGAAEVTKLRELLTASEAVVKERDESLVTLGKSVTDLQAANKKFADDMAGLVKQGEQLKTSQSVLEQAKKDLATLQAKLDDTVKSRDGLAGQALTRRRQDLVTKYQVPEDRVASLDDAGLAILESTLPHIKPGGNGANTGKGLGLGGGPGAGDLSDLSDSARALRTIERLKQVKS